MSTSHAGHHPDTMAALGARLRELGLGATRTANGLDLTALIAPPNGVRDYRLLHEAIDDIAIEEAAKEQVNRISVFNRGEKPVLILEGQTVTGAKQNRVVASTVLVPPGSMVGLDVGCVEQGRWSPRYGAFVVGTSSVSSLLRTQMAKAKTMGHVNQAALWSDVHKLMLFHKQRSATMDYVTLLETQKRKVDAQARALEPQPGQVGMIVLDGGRLVAMELLGHADAWRAMAERLVGSYLLGAEDRERGASHGHERAATAGDWLASLIEAPVTLHPAAGLGVRIGLQGPGPRKETVRGEGLWFEDRPLHLAAFTE